MDLHPLPPTSSRGLLLCFDGDCRICRMAVGLLPRLGLVPPERLAALQSFEGEVADLLLAQGAHNELAVMDPESLQVRRGFDGLLWALEDSWARPLLPLARLTPIRWLLGVLYRLIAYNRRILSPLRGERVGCACEPDFHLGQRLAFTALCGGGALLFAGAIGLLWPAAALLGVLAGAALPRKGAARADGLAHAAWTALLVTVAAGIEPHIEAFLPLGEVRGWPHVLVEQHVLALALLLVLVWQRRRTLSLHPVGALGLALLGALAAAAASSSA